MKDEKIREEYGRVARKIIEVAENKNNNNKKEKQLEKNER